MYNNLVRLVGFTSVMMVIKTYSFQAKKNLIIFAPSSHLFLLMICIMKNVVIIVLVDFEYMYWLCITELKKTTQCFSLLIHTCSPM